MLSLAGRCTFAASLLFARLFSLLLVVTLTFAIMKFLPGDPFNEEQALPAEIHRNLREFYGLQDAWPVQYLRYLKSIFTWNFGPSFRFPDLTVNQIIIESFPVSAILGLESLLFALSFGVAFGIIAAARQGKGADKMIFLFSALALSFPSFLLGSFLQFFLGFKWGLLPIARWGTFTQSILPALSLGMLPCAFIAKLTKAGLLDVLKQNYMRTAKAKGLGEFKAIISHGIKNACLPVIQYLGPLGANILVGSFVIEKIYAIPGLGQWFINSVLNRDYSVIMGLTVFYSVILLTLVLIMDLISLWIDPRIGCSK